MTSGDTATSIVAGPAPPRRPPARYLAATALVAASLILVTVLRLTMGTIGVWGLVPIVLYAALALLGVDIVMATVTALLVAVVQTATTPVALGELFAESLGSFIAVVGLIIVLGGALGQVAERTGAAQTLVRGLMNRIGLNTPARVQVGVMLSSTVLVGALGTLSGANALLAPIVVPIAAAVSRTPPSVAAMLHAGGAAGLFLGPFTPPVVTIMGAAGIGYGTYLLSAGIPMAVVTWGVGFGMARWIQRRTRGKDRYEEAEVAAAEQAAQPATVSARWATVGFLGTIVIMAVAGVIVGAGYTYALVVMLVTAAVTAALGRMRPTEALNAMYTGGSRLIWLFLLFWLFNPLLELVGQTGAYKAMLDGVRPVLDTLGPWGFCMLVLFIGWIGVAGAAVAQVVLMDKLFAPLLAGLGIPGGAWAAAMLGASQIDWFGPFPNADMVGQMGLARSRNLPMMLFNGWAIMIANIAMLAVLFLILL